MNDLSGQVAFITGVARGQGRSHAILLAEHGADIVGVDICAPVDTVGYALASEQDLAETVALVEATGHKMRASVVDVRDHEALSRAAQNGYAEFGRLDIVLANAGILNYQMRPYTRSRQAWHDSIDILLTGMWNTLQSTVPLMIDAGNGGAIVLTSSAAGIRIVNTSFDGGYDGYTAAKFAVVGLMRSYAGTLAKHNIRVNSIHPTGVNTPMVVNEYFGAWAAEQPEISRSYANALPIPMVEPLDVSRSVLHLVSESGRYITGHTMVVDAGQTTVALAGGGSANMALDPGV
ncbi:mycofactocin-coupled SDR family oxidoreductase [uncultured Jatrophihabitans sp.]|uniref:mycofactocin-coupled SDR family oxidoreductase n=1 Tax=uncultured Jatrophihabitans sp. TaxID=1610747 RepID=UPI0035CAE38B